MTEQRRILDRWHIAKDIPLALILAMMAQTAGIVWWAATTSEKIDNLIHQVADLRSGQSAQVAATRDIAVLVQRTNDLDRRVIMVEDILHKHTEKGG